jgi:hypothetical protein
MTDEWQDTPEEDGITLGPEEALEREIAKSKALKVERLQLRDQVERLTVQNRSLCDQLEALKQKPKGSPGDLEHSPDTPNSPHSGTPPPANGFLPNRWAFFLLVFNLTAIGLLLIYLLQKPVP